MSKSSSAERLKSVIPDKLRAFKSILVSFEGSYSHEYKWDLGYNKTSSKTYVNGDFIIELAAVSEPEKQKYLRIYSTESAVTPKVKDDNLLLRGSFTADASIAIRVIDDGGAKMTLVRSMPDTHNQQTDFSFTEKSGISLDGTKLKLSLESSTTKKISIKDFSVCQNGEGNKFLRWRYFNTQFEKDEKYLGSGFICNALSDLPSLSKNKLKLRAEAIYRIPPDFTGNIKLALGVYSKGAYHQIQPGTINIHHLETKVAGETKEVDVDFSQIDY